MIRSLVTGLALAASLGLSSPGAGQATEPVEIRHIANIGVMVSQGRTRLLMDAFADNSYDGRFSLPSDVERDAMIAGAAPFDDVDALLISHVHGDHFARADSIAFLSHAPEARFVAGPGEIVQAAPELGDGFHLFGECGPDSPRPAVEIAGSGHSVAGCESAHGMDVGNIAFLVQLSGLNILHLGDSSPTEADFSIWSDDRIDVVLYPYWFGLSDEARAVLTTHFPEARLVALHIPAGTPREDAEAAFGAGGFLLDPGETLVIEPAP